MAVISLADYQGYRHDFKNFISQRREPSTLQEQRRAALERFEVLGIPSGRQEGWRHTEVSAFAGLCFNQASDTPVPATIIPSPVGPQRLVFVNGRFSPGLSRLEKLPPRTVVTNLNQALSSCPKRLETHLGALPGLENHAFMALNSAFWQDGAFIYLPRGAVLEQPLHLVFYASGADTANYPRNLIILEEAAQAAIIEEYRGEGHYLTCPLTEIHAAQATILDYHRIQEEAPPAGHLGGLRLHQQRDSRIHGHFLSLAGRLVRTDIAALLDGEAAECILDGLNLVADGQLADQHIRMEHAVPRGVSRQNFKGVLMGKSRTVFDSLIHVRQHAQQTQATQLNHNLLLTRQALANSNPQMEILADDVQCSHGSTVGFLDAEAMFYLRSRGIGEAEARTMLVFAFANDIIQRIHLQPLRERLETVLRGRLRSAETCEKSVL